MHMPMKNAQHRNNATSEVRRRVETLTAAAQSESTKKCYASAVRHFLNFGGTIPCNAQMLMEYLATLSLTHKVASIELRVIAIHNAHVTAGHPSPATSPLVKRTMAGIRRTLGTAQRRVKALVKDDLLEALVLSDQQSPNRAARDKALAEHLALVQSAGNEVVVLADEELARQTMALNQSIACLLMPNPKPMEQRLAELNVQVVEWIKQFKRSLDALKTQNEEAQSFKASTQTVAQLKR